MTIGVSCEVVVMECSIEQGRILEPTLQRILRELGKPASLAWQSPTIA